MGRGAADGDYAVALSRAEAVSGNLNQGCRRSVIGSDAADGEQFYWSNPSPFHEGQLVIQVYKNPHGRTVSPPGHVIHTRSYRDGKERKTLIYVELPDSDWEPLSRFGTSLKKSLSRGGVRNYQPQIACWRSGEVS